MKTYKFTFKGREIGAIGIFYSLSYTTQADTAENAVHKLYENFEHITDLKCTENGKKIELTH